MEPDDTDPSNETPEQAVPIVRESRETRMQKRLKQAPIKPESEDAEDEVMDDLGADEDEDEEAEVFATLSRQILELPECRRTGHEPHPGHLGLHYRLFLLPEAARSWL